MQVFSSEIEETLQKLFHGTPLNICFSTLVLKNDNNTLLLFGRMVNLQEQRKKHKVENKPFLILK